MAIELEIPKRSVWVGETIPLNIDIYLQRDIGDLSVVVPLFDEFPVQPNSSIQGTQEFTLTTVHGDINLPLVQERVRKNNKEYTRVRLMAETTLTNSGKYYCAGLENIGTDGCQSAAWQAWIFSWSIPVVSSNRRSKVVERTPTSTQG